MSRALRVRHEERLVHSGQHWDDALSRVFFDELELPEPDLHLHAERMSTAQRMAHMIAGLRTDIRAWEPDVVLVYGDTDTTLAGALAARAERVPVAHVEAGMRSGVRTMPEEINRVAVDHLSAVLMTVNAAAAHALRSEGASGAVAVVGDVMLDALLAADVEAGGDTAGALGCAPGEYLVATIHRAATLADPDRLATLLRALDDLGTPVVLPAHPRTNAAIAELVPAVELSRLRVIEALPRGAMLELLRGARGVLTDSGGVQREAWFLGVPCATLRDRTEWSETLEHGWNRLVGADPGAIARAVDSFADARPERDLDRFGGGRASERVVAALEALVGAS